MFRAAGQHVLLAGAIGVLELGDFLRRRVPAAELVRALLGQPHRSVRRRHRGMDGGGALVRRLELVDLGGLGIEPADHVGVAVIGDPVFPLLVGEGAPRHAVGAGHVVFDIDDLERLVAQRRLLHLVILRHRGGRRQLGIGPEQRGQIGHHVGLVLRGEMPDAADEEMHRADHVIDPRLPCRRVGRRIGRHARFEAVAGEAIIEERLLAGRVGQQHAALIERHLGPLHRRRGEREIHLLRVVRAKPDLRPARRS